MEFHTVLDEMHARYGDAFARGRFASFGNLVLSNEKVHAWCGVSKTGEDAVAGFELILLLGSTVMVMTQYGAGNVAATSMPLSYVRGVQIEWQGEGTTLAVEYGEPGFVARHAGSDECERAGLSGMADVLSGLIGCVAVG